MSATTRTISLCLKLAHNNSILPRTNKTPRNYNYFSIDHFPGKFSASTTCIFPLLSSCTNSHSIWTDFINRKALNYSSCSTCSTQHLHYVQWWLFENSWKNEILRQHLFAKDVVVGQVTWQMNLASPLFAIRWHWDIWGGNWGRCGSFFTVQGEAEEFSTIAGVLEYEPNGFQSAGIILLIWQTWKSQTGVRGRMPNGVQWQ